MIDKTKSLNGHVWYKARDDQDPLKVFTANASLLDVFVADDGIEYGVIASSVPLQYLYTTQAEAAAAEPMPPHTAKLPMYVQDRIGDGSDE